MPGSCLFYITVETFYNAKLQIISNHREIEKAVGAAACGEGCWVRGGSDHLTKWGDLTKSQVTNFSRNAPGARGSVENYPCLSWSAPIYVVTRI